MHPTKILHPTDYSEASQPAMAEAIELAEQSGAPLVLLHVVETLGPEKLTFGEVSSAAQPGAYRERLWEELRHRLPADAHVHAQLVLSEEDVVTAILRTAAEMGCDLIVMGTHGVSGWRRWFTRSVAEEVVRQATCPVLIVKSEQEQPSLPEFEATDLHPGHLTESE